MGGGNRFEGPLPGLSVGDHLCWAFDDDDRFASALESYVADGLASGQRVACFLAEAKPEAFLDRLRERRPGTDEALEDGTLVLGSFEEAYLSGGAFDPDARIEDYERMARDALSDGYQGLRIMGEATAMVGAFPDEWPAYELRADLLAARYPLVALCAYDVRRCDSDGLDLLRSVHGRSFGAGEDGPVFHVRAGENGALAFAGEIDAACAPAVERAASRAAGDVASGVLDVRELRFVDASGVRAVAASARAMGGDGTAPVKIVGANRIFRRVWHLLGFDREVGAELLE